MANESFFLAGQTTSLMACVIDGEDIVQHDYRGQRQVVGKTLAAYDELQTTTQQYYDKLVELGEIVPPKSAEDMMAEMQGTMTRMTGAMGDIMGVVESLKKQVEELKKDGDGPCRCGSGENVSERERKRGGARGPAGNSGDA